jgi:hypothetical protein
MFDWLEIAQIHENMLQIVIIKISEISPGHGCIELTRSDIPRPNRPDEQGFVVVRDPRRIRRKVRSRYLAFSIGTFDHAPASIRKGMPFFVFSIVAIGAISDVG